MKKINMKKSRGFTLIELLVVVSIMLLFIGGTLASYNTYTEQTKLKNEAKKLVDVLELAKKKALSADLVNKDCVDFKGYRVSISQGSYSLQFVCASDYTNVQNYSLYANITVTSGLGNYDFTPLMINPVFSSGSISLNSATINKTINISVSPIGIITLDETLL